MNRLPPRAELFLARLSRRLRAPARVGFVLTAVCAALAVLAVIYTPRLYLLRRVHPDAFEWARALSYLRQCQHAFPVEPALRWRLLPAWIGQVLGAGHPLFPLVLAPLGVLSLLIYLAFVLERETGRLVAFLGVLLIATTSALITPVDWLGLHDAWAWLGLLVAAFSTSEWKRALVCFLCPWIDERFVLALPLALLICCRDRSFREHLSTFARATFFLAPYLAMRIVSVLAPVSPDHVFIADTMTGFRAWAPFLPLGWWMAYRGLWLVMIFALIQLGHGRYSVTALLTLVITGLLAGDISRSAADLLPLAVVGLILIGQKWPQKAGRMLAALFLAQLILPYAHVVSTWVVPVHGLPFEIARLFFSRAA